MNDDDHRPDQPAPCVPSLLEAELFPDDVAAWAASVTPGSATITALAAVELARLLPAGRVDALVAIQKHLGWLQAREHRLLAVMATAPVAPRSGG